MSTGYPHIRIHAEDGQILVREGLSLAFYMRRSHVELAEAILHSLEAYLHGVGRDVLRWYVDDAGEWQPLDAEGWTFVQAKLLTRQGGITRLMASPDSSAAYSVEYYGKPLDAQLLGPRPGAVCALGFRIPTEFLEEHGPSRLRELALEIARALPFCSGYVGLSLQGGFDLLGVEEKIAPYCSRHPGLDIPDLETLGWELGMRFRGPSWLTFLGQPLLGEAGGTEGLRTHLRTPGTTVQEMEGQRVCITLGEWPEVGDTQRGDSLPAYRELARILEPWLFHTPRSFMPGLRGEEVRRWEQRFL
jgi:hypothetical protein